MAGSRGSIAAPALQKVGSLMDCMGRERKPHHRIRLGR